MRTHRWRLTVAAALVLAAPGLSLTTSAASAQTTSAADSPSVTASPDAALTGEPDPRRAGRAEEPVTTLRQVVPGKESRHGWKNGRAEDAETRARQRILAREARQAFEAAAHAPDGEIAPLQDPPHHVSDCQEERFSAQRGGFVIDHFRYCEVTYWEVETTICTWRTWFGCWNRKEVSHAEFRMTTAG